MRRLHKSPKPRVLDLNESAWTADYAAACSVGTDKNWSRWKHSDVVNALVAETHHKCAYCEGVISDVSYPHVEHIFPKKKRPDLVVSWENLTLACGVCNLGKKDYYEPNAPLLNPYEDEPEESLRFRGPAVFAALGDGKGARSITYYKLMRPALLLERMKRLQHLYSLLDMWHSAHGPDKAFRLTLVEDAIAEDQEFCAYLRAEARAAGFPVVP